MCIGMFPSSLPVILQVDLQAANSKNSAAFTANTMQGVILSAAQQARK